MRKLLLIAGLAVGAAIGWAYAQTVVLQTISGAEIAEVSIGGQQGTSAFVQLNTIRNSTGYQLLSSASGTIQPTVAVNQLLVNAQPAASTAFVTPASPVSDGTLFSVCNVTASPWATNASTLAAATGQSINGGTVTTTTLGANNCIELQYQLSSTTWFRIR